ncbi:hypothetical protein [Risungbinella massiliensis]|uniref:hypothetical protein n=1 Tax=Risungbinella massiliensis TaxID=1329796 RepID=UPI0005CC6FC8|nr:hypothetical protein [Risungbinella massiliensis]
MFRKNLYVWGIGVVLLAGCSLLPAEKETKAPVPVKHIVVIPEPPKDLSAFGRLKSSIEATKKELGYHYEIKGTQVYKDNPNSPVTFQSTGVETFTPYTQQFELQYSGLREKIWTVGETTYTQSNTGKIEKMPYVQGDAHGSPTEIIRRLQLMSDHIQSGTVPKEVVQMKEEGESIELTIQADQVASLREMIEGIERKRSKIDPPEVQVEKTEVKQYQVKIWISKQSEKIERLSVLQELYTPSTYGPISFTQTTEVTVKEPFVGSIQVPAEIQTQAKSVTAN